jgi:hypothetical protein
VEGVKGLPPPPTTKVGLTAVGGYQAEFHVYICGLDLEAKAEWIERQIRYSAGEAVKELSCFKFSLNGYCPDNPRNQDVATCDLRIFVQTKNKDLVSKATLDVPGFNRWCMDNGEYSPHEMHLSTANVCCASQVFRAAQAGLWVMTKDNLKARYTMSTMSLCWHKAKYNIVWCFHGITTRPSTSLPHRLQKSIRGTSQVMKPKIQWT